LARVGHPLKNSESHQLDGSNYLKTVQLKSAKLIV